MLLFRRPSRFVVVGRVSSCSCMQQNGRERGVIVMRRLVEVAVRLSSCEVVRVQGPRLVTKRLWKDSSRTLKATGNEPGIFPPHNGHSSGRLQRRTKGEQSRAL